MDTINFKKTTEALAKAFNSYPSFTFVDKMAFETPYCEKEIQIFMDFNTELSEESVENILYYCMDSGGILKPLELTPLQIEKILKKP